MTVARKVEHLLLCEWFDETGRLHRQTFCPSQLALCERHAWVAVLASLARRYRVAATL